MKKLVGYTILVALVLAVAFFALTAFSKPTKPKPYTVRQASNIVVSYFDKGLQSRGDVVSRTRCAAFVNGHASRAASTGTSFGCILDIRTATGSPATCAFVRFDLAAKATTPKVTVGQRISTRYCS